MVRVCRDEIRLSLEGVKMRLWSFRVLRVF